MPHNDEWGKITKRPEFLAKITYGARVKRHIANINAPADTANAATIRLHQLMKFAEGAAAWPVLAHLAGKPADIGILRGNAGCAVGRTSAVAQKLHARTAR